MSGNSTVAVLFDVMGRCSRPDGASTGVTSPSQLTFAAPPGQAGSCGLSVAALDTSTRTQNGHIRNDTRDAE
jgi:hypothetical protein